jgi:hypothetical protein
MNLRNRFTPDEWDDLCSAPFAAAMYVATSDGGHFDYTQEMVALMQAIGPSMAGAGRLAQAVIAGFGSRRANMLGTGELAIAREDRGAMLALLERVGAALARAGTHEAAPYASWVLGLARHVAAASRHGGLLGLGGRTISTAEEVALAELKTALRAGAP